MTQRLVIPHAGAAPELQTVATEPGGVTLVAAEVLPLDLQLADGRLPSVRPDRLAAGQVAVGRQDDGTLVSVQGGPAGFGLGAPAGTFATEFSIQGASVCPLPRGLDPLVAAAGVSSAMAARLALDLAGVGGGARVAVTGAGGAVGSATCQLAAARGFEVIGLGRGSSATTLAEMAPFDAVVDCAAGPLLMDLVRPSGARARHVVVGYVDDGLVHLPLPLLLMREHQLVGFNIYRTPREAFEAAHAAALADLAAGVVTVPAHRLRTVPLGDAAEVYAGTLRVLFTPPE